MIKKYLILAICFLIIDVITFLIFDKKENKKTDVVETANFEKELNLIKDETLVKFIEFYLKKVPNEFWTMPASTSGKYHPEFALGKGGLVRHTKAAIKIAESLLNLEMYKDLDKDLIITALMLHDSVKPGFTEEGKPLHTQIKHPIFATELLAASLNEYEKDLSLEERIKLKKQVEDIQRMIKSHMGQWNTDKEGNEILPKPEKEDEKFVHMCDYLASRKFLEINLEV